jgi:putative PIN family toxin of toxin-antitoxin system
VNVVLDTNIVLDLWVFRDERVASLHEDLAAREVTWLATAAMRDELACVLAYENISARMAAANVSSEHVLGAFDTHANIVDAAPAVNIACRDTDDQKFIDLAVAHGAKLISKDKQVLALRRKLVVHGVEISAQP